MRKGIYSYAKERGGNMVKESQLRATAKYDKANTKGLYLKLNVKTDADIIQRLDKEINKQGYIKQLIRDDLNK